MSENLATVLIFLITIHWITCLVPPKFQWKTIDFTWEGGSKEKAIADKSYIPRNIMPTGLARWKNKLFITIPRWKKGKFVKLGARGFPLLFVHLIFIIYQAIEP